MQVLRIIRSILLCSIVFLPMTAQANSNPSGAVVECLSTSADTVAVGQNNLAQAEWASTETSHNEIDSFLAFVHVGFFDAVISNITPDTTSSYWLLY